jgi:hypothetical protein
MLVSGQNLGQLFKTLLFTPEMGGGDDCFDAGSGGDMCHGEGLVQIRRAVIETGQNMAVNVDQGESLLPKSVQ